MLNCGEYGALHLKHATSENILIFQAYTAQLEASLAQSNGVTLFK